VRVYDMPSDFIRFAWDAFFYKSSSNRIITEYPGGQRRLRKEIYNYKSQNGEPNWWYWEPSSKKKVAFYQVPNGNYTYTYDYQRSVYVTIATDEMPFHNQEEADAFCHMAERRFKYLFERAENMQLSLDRDMIYRDSKSRLYGLLRPVNPRRTYGRAYL